MKKIILLITILLATVFNAIAADVTIDCTQTNLQTAITNHSSGDTITCNAGNVTWSEAFTGLDNAKHLKLKGTSTNVTWTGGTSIPLQFNDSTKVKEVEISGFNFSASSASGYGLMQLYQGKRLIVHGCTFTFTGADVGALSIIGGYGLIYNNTFSAVGGGQFIRLHPDYLMTQPYWTSAGSSQGYGETEVAGTTYIEGNTFTFSSYNPDDLVDSKQGASLVFRYNTVTGGGPVGGHGEDSSQSNRMKYVHNNAFASSGRDFGATVQFRSASGVVHDNAFTGTGSPIGIYATNYRSCTAWRQLYTSSEHFCSTHTSTLCTTDAQCVSWYGAGETCSAHAPIGLDAADSVDYAYCTNKGSSTPYSGLYVQCDYGENGDSKCTALGLGTCNRKYCSTFKDTFCTADSDCPDYATGETCSAFKDGTGTNNYPARHQLGIGVNEESHPIYQWKNTVNGSNHDFTNIVSLPNCTELGGTDYITTHVQEDRDYFNYVTGTGFDGTTGVGDSRDVERPATCTTGVGWWDNAAKKFYRCTATNTWTEYFAQATCPHPLAGYTGYVCNTSIAGTGGYPGTLGGVSSYPTHKMSGSTHKWSGATAVWQ